MIFLIFYLILIGLYYYYYKFKGSYNILNFIETTIYLSIITLIIFWCFNSLIPYIFFIERRNFIIYICIGLFYFMYLSLDFHQKNLPFINQIAKSIIISYYFIFYVVHSSITFERKWIIFSVYFILTFMFNIVSHLVLFFSNKFILEIKNKSTLIEKLNTRISFQEKENLIKSNLLLHNNKTIHSMKQEALDAIDLQGKGDYNAVLEKLINSYIVLINANSSNRSGNVLMDEVLNINSRALLKKDIDLDIDFRTLDLKENTYDQLRFFRLLIESILKNCENESIKIESIQKNNNTIILITFYNENNTIIPKELKDHCEQSNYYIACITKNSIKYLSILI